MKLLILLGILTISFQTYAFDLQSWIEKLRAPMISIIGESVTEKLLGSKPTSDDMKLPPIPKIIKDSTSTDVYDKSGPLHSQGEKYNSLSLEEKRSYRLAFLEELFQVVRKERASNEDLGNLLNVLEQGGTREGIYRSLILDRTYQLMEASEDYPSKQLVDFVFDFSERYFGQTYNKETIKKLNRWAIKRIITEKGFEILYAYEKNPEHLYRWYGVFSADMARRFPELWKNKTRQNKAPEFHMSWAKKSPLQHIKSEMIIKLHTVMNSLHQ